MAMFIWGKKRQLILSESEMLISQVHKEFHWAQFGRVYKKTNESRDNSFIPTCGREEKESVQ